MKCRPQCIDSSSIVHSLVNTHTSPISAWASIHNIYKRDDVYMNFLYILYGCIDAQSYNIRVDIDRTFVTRPLVVGYNSWYEKCCSSYIIIWGRRDRIKPLWFSCPSFCWTGARLRLILYAVYIAAFVALLPIYLLIRPSIFLREKGEKFSSFVRIHPSFFLSLRQAQK